MERQGTALITGASSGIGAEFARQLASEYDLTLVARRTERLESLRSEILSDERDGSIRVLTADLTRRSDLDDLARLLETEPIDLLVNNAGIGTYGPFHTIAAEREEQMVSLNVQALLRLTRAALSGMVKRERGAVINVSSLASFQPTPWMSTYGATKAFVTSLTEGLAIELKGTGVRVQALCPGPVKTEFADVAGTQVLMERGPAAMTARRVVSESLAALQKEKVICIPGAMNRLAVWGERFVPRTWVARMAGGVMEPDGRESR